ncbi:MAG: universal stress protein [Nocardioidaceae bacterium]|nr:universal stress protein [Nocardioidaceae bacterium]
MTQSTTPQRPAGSITVGVDESDESRSAAQVAVDLAAPRRDVVRLVHARSAPAPFGAYDAGVVDDSRRNAESLVQAVVTTLAVPTGVMVETYTEASPAVSLLVRVAQDSRLLVVGRHGGLAHRVVDGNIASLVASHAVCPVLTVTPGRDHPVDAARIVVAVDDLDQLGTVLEFAMAEASSQELAVELVHDVVRPSNRGDDWTHRLDDLVSTAQTAHPDVAVTTLTTHGSRRDALVDASRLSAMLVIGRPKAITGVPSWTASVAHALMGRSHCPVVVVPTGRATAHHQLRPDTAVIPTY